MQNIKEQNVIYQNISGQTTKYHRKNNKISQDEISPDKQLKYHATKNNQSK